VKFKSKSKRFHDPAQRLDVRPDASRFKASDGWLMATKTIREVSLG
jgi:hypothetical protein